MESISRGGAKGIGQIQQPQMARSSQPALMPGVSCLNHLTWKARLFTKRYGIWSRGGTWAAKEPLFSCLGPQPKVWLDYSLAFVFANPLGKENWMGGWGGSQHSSGDLGWFAGCMTLLVEGKWETSRYRTHISSAKFS